MIDAEHTRRLNLWKHLRTQHGSERVSPSVLRELGIYGGAQGIWRDVDQTAKLTENFEGITVSVLHTGQHYPDDWTSDGVLYHYPHTDRPPTLDRNEIAATKAAGAFRLPIFVISHNNNNRLFRDVHLGWICGWDDASELFLILFQREPPEQLIVDSEDETQFRIFDERPIKHSPRKVRDNQARFRFQVIQRYGAQCALCHVAVNELLEAVHLVPKSASGTDDPRNGLILCVLHHRAFDTGLIGIDPESTAIRYLSNSVTKDKLGIVFDDLAHLSRLPHKDALQWNWERFK